MTSRKIYLAVDCGLSETKAFWLVPNGAPKLMLIGSEIIGVEDSDLLDRGLKGGKPENNALLEIGSGALYAVGKSARELRGVAPIHESKYQPAVFKIMATIGAIIQTMGWDEPVSVVLSTLLPYSEYQDRQTFIELLRQHLKAFSFNKQPMKVSLEKISVKPEGAGITTRHLNTSDRFEDENTLTIMIGHRDASILPFEQGSPSTGVGEQLGFIAFMDQISTRASLNLTLANQAKLPEYLFKAQKTPKYIEQIAKMVVTGSEVSRKTKVINEAIAASRTWYVKTLTSWIEQTLGSFLDETDRVLISGGTALYLKQDLESFFLSYPNLEETSLSWGLETQTEIEALLNKKLTPELCVRLSDVFGLFEEVLEQTDFNFNSIQVHEAHEAHEAPLQAVTANTSTNGRGRSKHVKLPDLSKASD